MENDKKRKEEKSAREKQRDNEEEIKLVAFQEAENGRSIEFHSRFRKTSRFSSWQRILHYAHRVKISVQFTSEVCPPITTSRLQQFQRLIIHQRILHYAHSQHNALRDGEREVHVRAMASSIKVTLAKWAVLGIPRQRIPWAWRHSYGGNKQWTNSFCQTISVSWHQRVVHWSAAGDFERSQFLSVERHSYLQQSVSGKLWVLCNDKWALSIRLDYSEKPNWWKWSASVMTTPHPTPLCTHVSIHILSFSLLKPPAFRPMGQLTCMCRCRISRMCSECWAHGVCKASRELAENKETSKGTHSHTRCTTDLG